jgi:hypothetical protein
MDDILFHLGGAVKATADSPIIEGLLIPYGSPEDLDHDGEFFSPQTDLGLRLPAAVKLHYNHGINAEVGKVPLAWAELEARADGVWFKADLSEDLDEWLDEEREKAKKYQTATLRLAREGLLGASSGAASHLVTRRAAGKGQELLRWPTAEASVTPHPASPATFGRVSIKSLRALPDPETLLANPDALKCCGCGMPWSDAYRENLPAEATIAALARLNDNLFYRTVQDTVRDENTPVEEKLSTLREAFDQNRDLALRIIGAIMGGAGGEDAKSAVKAIATLWGPERVPATAKGSVPDSLAEHSAQVVTAVAELVARLAEREEFRAAKDGRELSSRNIADLEALLSALESVQAQCESVRAMIERNSRKTTAEPDTALDAYIRFQHTLATLQGVAA